MELGMGRAVFLQVCLWVTLCHYDVSAVPEWSCPVNGASWSFLESLQVDGVIGCDLQASDTTTYSIVSITPTTSAFALDSSQLRLQSTMDFETADDKSYSVVFRAAGSGGTADITVTVTVTDVNDNSPVLTISLTHPTLLEFSPPDTNVADLSHTDADVTSAFKQATYAITGGDPNNRFKIAGSILETASALIDYTETNSFTLTITATDTDQPSRIHTQTVAIPIKTRPVITTPVGATIDFPEGKVAGETLTSLAATDTDLDTVIFSISPASDKFEIAATNNKVIVSGGNTFDYEQLGDATYTLTIIASDGTYSAEKTITVTLTDVNDVAPVVTITPDSVNLLEKSPADTVVATISSSDGDTSSEFQDATYTITGGNTDARFTIDNQNRITTADALIDFGDTPSFTLTITATDGVNEGTDTIDITTETKPIYTDPVVAKTVDLVESSVAGHPVMTVGVGDEDILPSPLSVTLASQSESWFEVVDNELRVATGVTLDFETAPITADVQFRAYDGKYTVVSETVTVQLTNVNEAPMFTSATSPIPIRETAAFGDEVYTATAEDPEDDTITFSITSGDTNGDFSMDGTSGVITVAKTLDPDTKATYELVLKAVDAAPLEVTMIATVTVHDAPKITNPPANDLTESVAENEATGTSVITLAATDADSNDVTFSISDQSVANTFKLDVSGTELQTATSLDHEDTESYTVTIVATDDSQFTLSSSVILTVTVTDVNEAPIFADGGEYTSTVTEASGSDVVVYTLVASDVDEADTEPSLVFTITEGSVYFKLDATKRKILTKGDLFYDASPSYEVLVTAEDGGSLQDTATVTVSVDTIPGFEQPPADHTITIPEATAVDTEVFTIVGVDRDGNTDLVYSLTSGGDGKFDVEENKVVVKGTLDFETKTSYGLVLKVVDSNDHTATVSMTISISDSNDQSPVFVLSAYAGSTLEKVSEATSVLTVSADDGDTDFQDNNVIQYSIKGGNDGGLFSIDGSSGEISATNLNYETQALHELTIAAKDKNGATGANEVTVEAAIGVITKPAFTTPPSPGTSISINEDHAANTKVTEVTADDADGNAVTYSLTQSPASPAMFVIPDQNSGVIKSKMEPFDVDPDQAVTQYTLTISAMDTLHTTETTLVVLINDVNDNDPVFEPDTYNEDVQENLAVGGSVATVTASDADLSTSFKTITYSITEGDTNNQFTMVGSQINLLSSLEFDDDSSYTLTVTASDGQASDTATVSLDVKSVPDFILPPMGGATATVDEDASAGELVYTTSAEDADGDTSLTYSITSQSVSDLFTMDGRELQLNTDQTLDFETNPGPFTVTFSVEDTDGNIATSQTLSVSVNDVNDNAPLFSSTTYTKTVKTGLAAESTILQLTASDADGSSPNNALSYMISGGGNTGSDIAVSSSGLLTVANQLDITRTPSYTITVKVSDGATSPMTGDTTVTITVSNPTDVVITGPASGGAAVNVPEDKAVGQTVFEILATDADGDELSYSIKSISPASHFTVVGNSLTVSTALDYEGIGTYAVDFYVDDNDGNSANRKSSGLLTITILDVNDFPVFDIERHDVDVMESQAAGTHVVQVNATNQDAGQTLVYKIVAGDPLNAFTFKAAGQMVTTIALDRDLKTYYLLAVQAVDNGSPNKADSTHVFVNVTPLNAGGKLMASLWSFLLLFIMLATV